MPNPRPIQTEELKAKQYKAIGFVDSPLSKKLTAIKLPVDVQEKLDALPPEVRVPFLRQFDKFRG